MNNTQLLQGTAEIVRDNKCLVNFSDEQRSSRVQTIQFSYHNDTTSSGSKKCPLNFGFYPATDLPATISVV